MVTADCEAMAEMATSIPLRLSLLVNFHIALISIPIFMMAFYYILKSKIFHKNTRIQIQVHIFGLVLHSVGRLALHSWDLRNYLSGFRNGCEILPDFYRCLISRGLYNFGLSMVEVCSISLAIERIIAYRQNRTYENSSILIGITLGALQFVFAFCFLYKLYYYAPFKPSDEIVLYYCQTLASGNGSVWTINAPLYATMVSHILCRVVFHVLTKKNQNLRIADQFMNLSSRYTLEQGIRSIKILKKLINVNTVVFAVLSVVETTLHFNKLEFSSPTYFALVEIVHLYPSYGIFLAIYLYWTIRKLDKTSNSQFVEVMHPNQDTHFKLFDKMTQPIRNYSSHSIIKKKKLDDFQLP